VHYLLVITPDAEWLVGHWRAEHDPSAARGIPAHVTVRSPFLPPEAWDTAGLSGRLGHFLPLPVTLARTEDRPGALVIVVEPDDRLRALTTAASAAWPELPPHKPQFPRYGYHVTVVRTPDETLRRRARMELDVHLPLTVMGTALWAASGTSDSGYASRVVE
jgi:hypothetical protein